jgi:regulator of protease activity HflC (stomatin/prohibitin superfamily)
MHSGMRSNIEAQIKAKMGDVLLKQGIIVESVLMKSIQLPVGLASSVERKLNKMQCEWNLFCSKKTQKGKLLKQRNKRFSKIVAEGLNNDIIKLRSIEAFLELSKSSNSKS